MSRSVDFSQGCPTLAAYFRSVIFILEYQDNEFSIPTERIVTWLNELNSWYIEVTGINRGCNLHLAYHRSVELIAPQMLNHVDKVEYIGLTCRAMGYGFAITVSAEEAIEHRNNLEHLIRVGAIHHLGINLIGIEPDIDREVRELVEFTANTSVQVALLGSISVQRRVGLLISPSINRADVTLYPANVASSSSIVSPQTHQPCANRFRLYVQSDGRIYPCLGLLGESRASLGSIYQPVSETVLNGHTYDLHLERLAVQGPSLDDLNVYGSPNVDVCMRHRMTIERCINDT